MSTLSSDIARKEDELRVLREKQELAAKKQQIIKVQERLSEQHTKLARQTEQILEQQAKQQNMSNLKKLQIHAQKAPLAKL
jgi:hypothetical protein